MPDLLIERCAVKVLVVIRQTEALDGELVVIENVAHVLLADQSLVGGRVGDDGPVGLVAFIQAYVRQPALEALNLLALLLGGEMPIVGIK